MALDLEIISQPNTKSTINKRKIVNWTSIKVKNFCASMDTTTKVKRQPTAEDSRWQHER